jgi:hypothetical protein
MVCRVHQEIVDLVFNLKRTLETSKKLSKMHKTGNLKTHPLWSQNLLKNCLVETPETNRNQRNLPKKIYCYYDLCRGFWVSRILSFWKLRNLLETLESGN